MHSPKEIIVVSPEDYKALARKLTHEISKLPNCNGAFWTIKQFEENELQLGGNRYVILIGNPDENHLTKDFLPVIKTLQSQAGACYGYDGSKAVIFGDGKLENSEELKKVLAQCAAIGAAGYTTVATVGAGIAMNIFLFLPVSLFFLPLIYKSSINAKVKKFRHEQTKAALTLFLAECFDAWAGLEKTEKKV